MRTRTVSPIERAANRGAAHPRFRYRRRAVFLAVVFFAVRFLVVRFAVFLVARRFAVFRAGRFFAVRLLAVFFAARFLAGRRFFAVLRGSR